MALTPEEARDLAHLMGKAEFPVPEDVFYAWCGNFPVISIELACLRAAGREIFLTYREDAYFKGWHIPGTILRPQERNTDALRRLAAAELPFPIAEPEFVSWFERPKGEGVGQSTRGDERAFLYSVMTEDVPGGTSKGRFFSFDDIPPALIGAHTPLIEYLKRGAIAG